MNMKAVKSRYYLPLKKHATLHLNKRESPLPMVAMCQVWLTLELLLYFRYYLSLVKCISLISVYLNFLYPRMFCARFGRNWPSGSVEEDDNLKSLQIDRWTDRQKAIRKAQLSFHSFHLQIKYIFNYQC